MLAKKSFGLRRGHALEELDQGASLHLRVDRQSEKGGDSRRDVVHAGIASRRQRLDSRSPDREHSLQPVPEGGGGPLERRVAARTSFLPLEPVVGSDQKSGSIVARASHPLPQNLVDGPVVGGDRARIAAEVLGRNTVELRRDVRAEDVADRVCAFEVDRHEVRSLLVVEVAREPLRSAGRPEDLSHGDDGVGEIAALRALGRDLSRAHVEVGRQIRIGDRAFFLDDGTRPRLERFGVGHSCHRDRKEDRGRAIGYEKAFDLLGGVRRPPADDPRAQTPR